MKHKFYDITKRLARIKKANLYRNLTYTKLSGPYIIIGKRKLVNLSSNDYLALGVSNPAPMQIQSSSRLVTGNDYLFKKLESKLAAHKSQKTALTFPSGYMANLGVISILPQKDDLIISDELNHASIIDACRLASSRKTIYKHNDMADLEKKLRTKGLQKFVITEGIFSMNGDFARLKEITELCQKYGAILILDDAHGDFVAGRDGRGSADHFGISNKVDVYVSSLSKGLGAFGGYVASKKEISDLIVNTSRPFIYTSALPNFVIQMAFDKFLSNREERRIKLWKNIELFTKGLESLGYSTTSQSQIIPLIVGDEKLAMSFGRYLFNKGIFAQPIRYPTVKLGSARIRISITSWLTEDIISRSIDVFEMAGKEFGIL